MRGQWRGPYVGSNAGQMVVEIDDAGDHFEGSAYLHDQNPQLPGVYAYIETLNKDARQIIRPSLFALHPQTGVPTPFDQLAEFFPDVRLSAAAEAELSWDAEHLKVQWKTDAGTFGNAQLPRSRASEPSECPVLPISNWEEFKVYAVNLEPHRFIFRGQPGQWRLRTAFHRTGRANLDKYLLVDLPIVHRHLSAVTKHNFDVRDPLQNAAFFNLVQHHGFPTPLLDWTYSPFVAAHFAFTRGTDASAADFLRIYVFDKKRWCKKPQIQNTVDQRPHFSIIESLALDNNRMVPQQALSSFTNLDDIEGYIQANEGDGLRYLTAIDLPVAERSKVIKELRLMGITHGALFPGLDGACAELRERFFPEV